GDAVTPCSRDERLGRAVQERAAKREGARPGEAGWDAEGIQVSEECVPCVPG
ncbi:Hypothetical predicted protein, partial [Podarcis lilfordi]